MKSILLSHYRLIAPGILTYVGKGPGRMGEGSLCINVSKRGCWPRGGSENVKFTYQILTMVHCTSVQGLLWESWNKVKVLNIQRLEQHWVQVKNPITKWNWKMINRLPSSKEVLYFLNSNFFYAMDHRIRIWCYISSLYYYYLILLLLLSFTI